MQFLKRLDNIFGGILYLIFTLPFATLAAISRLFIFLDPLFKGEFRNSLRLFIDSPRDFAAILFIGFASGTVIGAEYGLLKIVLDLPAASVHFFKRQLLFGLKENEHLRAIYKYGLDGLAPKGFFGDITFKLLTLCSPMNAYAMYDSGLEFGHSNINIYYTEKNLKILKDKYQEIEREQAAAISKKLMIIYLQSS